MPRWQSVCRMALASAASALLISAGEGSSGRRVSGSSVTSVSYTHLFCIGRDVHTGSVWQRARKAVTIFSIMVTWALENAIETADSMKSRGYGLKGRTAFSIFRMEERDRYALLWLGFCGVYLTCGAIAEGLKWRYFPALTGVLAQPMTVSFYLVYLALCLTPVILDRREAVSYTHLDVYKRQAFWMRSGVT